MAFERIDGADDPRVRGFRDVPDSERLRAHGLFVAEGRLVVRRVIESGRYRVRAVLVSEAARESLGWLLERVAATAPVYVCVRDDFRALTGFNLHRGCLALVERPEPTPASALLPAARTLVVLEGVANADNVGGVFRNAAAFGADAVLLSPTTCDPLYRKAIRTSMAATLRVPFARLTPWPAALDTLRAAGITLVALTPRPPAETLADFVAERRPSRIALLVGTEGAGLSPEAEASADVRVRIPMRADVDSLNLAVATGIALAAINPDPPLHG